MRGTHTHMVVIYTFHFHSYSLYYLPHKHTVSLYISRRLHLEKVTSSPTDQTLYREQAGAVTNTL